LSGARGSATDVSSSSWGQLRRSRCERCAECAEAVWWHCHRRIITVYLLAAGTRVEHIMGPRRRSRQRRAFWWTGRFCILRRATPRRPRTTIGQFLEHSDVAAGPPPSTHNRMRRAATTDRPESAPPLAIARSYARFDRIHSVGPVRTYLLRVNAFPEWTTIAGSPG
jgi:hypothetical protein